MNCVLLLFVISAIILMDAEAVPEIPPTIMNGVQGSATLPFKVQLINHLGRYLTAKTTGFEVDVSEMTMHEEQVWVVEYDSVLKNVVYIKSHLNRHLSADRNGNVLAAQETLDESSQFSVRYDAFGSGKWAFQNVKNGCFLETVDGKVMCHEKSPTTSKWWTIRLAVHPQVNIRNVKHKTYVHLANDKLQCDKHIPWGSDSLITLEFKGGKYSIRSSAGKYLTTNGSLDDDSRGPETKFTLEIRLAGIAFKDLDGKYLMCAERDSVLQSRRTAVGEEQLFTLEDSLPLVSITAHKGKKVSVKQGVYVTANQEEVTDTEIFQVEFDKIEDQWRFQTADNRFWTRTDASSIKAIETKRSQSTLFSIEYLDDGHVALKATNGMYVSARYDGSLYAMIGNIGEREKFIITVMNRPTLVLKCNYGFLGITSANNNRLECNKTNLDYINLEQYEYESLKWRYQLKGHNGLYWSVDDDNNINAISVHPKPFILEMHGQSQFAIKAPNDNYIKGYENGVVSATARDVGEATLWEY